MSEHFVSSWVSIGMSNACCEPDIQLTHTLETPWLCLKGNSSPRFMQYNSKAELFGVIDLTKLTPSKRQKLLRP